MNALKLLHIIRYTTIKMLCFQCRKYNLNPSRTLEIFLYRRIHWYSSEHLHTDISLTWVGEIWHLPWLIKFWRDWIKKLKYHHLSDHSTWWAKNGEKVQYSKFSSWNHFRENFWWNRFHGNLRGFLKILHYFSCFLVHAVNKKKYWVWVKICCVQNVFMRRGDSSINWISRNELYLESGCKN